jgi:hypothetical protein
MNDVFLSEYEQIFCDSLEALNWARSNGLRKNAIIKTNAPALLWSNDPLIHHIDANWEKQDFKDFQKGIQDFSDIVYQVLIDDPICKEFALVLAQQSVILQKIVYKAGCLKKDDLLSPRLFLNISSNIEPVESKINPIWDQLLINNKHFKVLTYNIQNDKWKKSDPKLIPLFDRMRFGGFETLFYRLALIFWSKIPFNISPTTILISKENELIIETASSLALQGKALKRIQLQESIFDAKLKDFEKKEQRLKQLIQPILKNWLSKWIIPELVSTCENLIIDFLAKELYEFLNIKKNWIKQLENQSNIEIALINSPGNIQGVAFYEACKEKSIKVISAQHGVTNELMELKNEWLVNHEVNASDCCLVYNPASYNEMKKSPYSIGNPFIVGMSNRHHRVGDNNLKKEGSTDIVYISTNLYKGNLNYFGGYINDFDRAKRESNIVLKVLAKLPCKVRYKSYPEDTRRYVDKDPVLSEVESTNNIELFDSKIDMRYLLAQHKIIVTSLATSTLGWVVQTKKPIVFINWNDNCPLNDEAYRSFSKGLFLFDGNNKNFQKNLVQFLSQPVSNIENLWRLKSDDFNQMLEYYFTCSSAGAGKRAAKMINKEFF